MYGPKSCQGGDRPEPWHWQEIHHILDLVEQVNAGNSLGLQYQVSLESLRFELGLPGPITNAPFKQMKECTTSCLLKGVWEFCSKYQLGIRDTFGDLPLQREGDDYLMLLFLKANYKPHDLKLLNECRMYLQVSLQWQTLQSWMGLRSTPQCTRENAKNPASTIITGPDTHQH